MKDSANGIVLKSKPGDSMYLARIAAAATIAVIFISVVAHADLVLISEKAASDPDINLKRAMYKAVYGHFQASGICPGQVSGAVSLPPMPIIPTDSSYFTDRPDPTSPIGTNLDPARIPVDRRKFCMRTPEQVATDIAACNAGLMSGMNNLLGFINPKGQFQTGLCWFHSRYQRSASYLANFVPCPAMSKCVKPDDNEVRAIVHALAIDPGLGKSHVVTIRGFANLEEFSKKYEKLITAEEQALAYTSVDLLHNVVQPDALTRLGNSSAWGSAADTRDAMDKLYDRMRTRPQIIFQRLKKDDYGPATEHSLLITGMTPITAEPQAGNPLAATRIVGYEVHAIDPNSRYPVTLTYKNGDTALEYYGHKVRLYNHYDDDVPDFERALSAFCRPPWPAQ